MNRRQIAHALMEGSWAELRDTDWDLSTLPVGHLYYSDSYHVQVGTRLWSGLLQAIKEGVPTGLRLRGASAFLAYTEEGLVSECCWSCGGGVSLHSLPVLRAALACAQRLGRIASVPSGGRGAVRADKRW